MSKPNVTLAAQQRFIDLDRRRLVKFNFLSIAALQDAGYLGKNYAEKVGDGAERKLRVNYRNLLTYLWAALQSDFERNGNPLSIDELADLITPDRISDVLDVVSASVKQYYNVEPGKAVAAGAGAAPAASE